jgi:hypothetical protein
MQDSKQTNVTLWIVPSSGFSPTKWASSLFKHAYTYQSLLAAKFAMLYLDLPSIVLLANVIQPLTDATHLYLASWYKNITR